LNWVVVVVVRMVLFALPTLTLVLVRVVVVIFGVVVTLGAAFTLGVVVTRGALVRTVVVVVRVTVAADASSEAPIVSAATPMAVYKVARLNIIRPPCGLASPERVPIG